MFNYQQQKSHDNVFSRICLCNALTFESLDLEVNFWYAGIYLQNIYVKFIHQGHQVKVKVTGANEVHNICALYALSDLFLHTLFKLF